MPYTRLNVIKQGSIFSAVRTYHTSRSNSLQFQLRKPHLVYSTTVVVYCRQKFNLQLNFTITFQIRNKTNQQL